MAKTLEQKAKAALYAREDRKKNPDRWRSADLKKSFGITLDQYNVLLEEQNGVCAICGNPETVIDNRTKQHRSLAVDHCHTTKKVRGLLCMGCNQGIGNFRENPQFLVSATSYVMKHNGP
jgi:hypothetical protein